MSSLHLAPASLKRAAHSSGSHNSALNIGANSGYLHTHTHTHKHTHKHDNTSFASETKPYVKLGPVQGNLSGRTPEQPYTLL